jgi:hypothetical protein
MTAILLFQKTIDDKSIYILRKDMEQSAGGKRVFFFLDNKITELLFLLINFSHPHLSFQTTAENKIIIIATLFQKLKKKRCLNAGN